VILGGEKGTFHPPSGEKSREALPSTKKKKSNESLGGGPYVARYHEKNIQFGKEGQKDAARLPEKKKKRKGKTDAWFWAKEKVGVVWVAKRKS